MKYLISLLFFISLSSLHSCTGSNRASVFAQDKDNTVTIERFDKDLQFFLQGASTEKENDLREKYKDFLNAFGTVTTDNSDYSNPLFFASIVKYFSNEMLSRIYKDAIDKFQVAEPYEKQLSDANVLIGQLLGGKQLPTLCMHISGFKANTIVMQNLISISTDRYLGKDYPPYKEFFEEYQRIQMQPRMIVRDYVKAWLMGELPDNNKRKDLLSEMINQGKILYALQQILPEWSEADLIGYTPEQMEWANKNRKNIWKTTVKQNYLYSTEYMTIVKYMDDAPYTVTISPESPGRIGAWIGWQIVKKYAENTNSDLDAILKETDSQSILKNSKYKP